MRKRETKTLHGTWLKFSLTWLNLLVVRNWQVPKIHGGEHCDLLPFMKDASQGNQATVLKCLVPFDCQGCQQYLVGLIVRAKKKSCGLAYWTHNGKWLDTRLKRMSEKFMWSSDYLKGSCLQNRLQKAGWKSGEDQSAQKMYCLQLRLNKDMLHVCWD